VTKSRQSEFSKNQDNADSMDSFSFMLCIFLQT